MLDGSRPRYAATSEQWQALESACRAIWQADSSDPSYGRYRAYGWIDSMTEASRELAGRAGGLGWLHLPAAPGAFTPPSAGATGGVWMRPGYPEHTAWITPIWHTAHELVTEAATAGLEAGVIQPAHKLRVVLPQPRWVFGGPDGDELAACPEVRGSGKAVAWVRGWLAGRAHGTPEWTIDSL